MKGLGGTLTLEGELGPYLPLLYAAEKTHLGKQTTFGLGRVRVEREGELRFEG